MRDLTLDLDLDLLFLDLDFVGDAFVTSLVLFGEIFDLVGDFLERDFEFMFVYLNN
jgi:hypothetical protein